MTIYQIEPLRENVHGPFSRDRAPILTIDPGDTVIVRTLDASWGRAGRTLVPDAVEFESDPEVDTGHALCGPITIAGAQSGDVLEVRIGEIRPGSWGWTWAGPRPWLNDRVRIEDEIRIAWRLDADAGTATALDLLGITIPIAPFMGVMGNAPAADGFHSTAPPRRVGGNLDCRELVTGSTLWLPVEVDGALFSVGDGHARQADGEVSCTAIECPMERVELTFDLRKDMAIDAPQAATPAGYVTIGLGESLDDATDMAVNAMLDHMQQTYGFTRPQALALASLLVDVRVTQIVNGTKGVHAVLPHDALPRERYS